VKNQEILTQVVIKAYCDSFRIQMYNKISIVRYLFCAHNINNFQITVFQLVNIKYFLSKFHILPEFVGPSGKK
jgi:hypothetical protein